MKTVAQCLTVVLCVWLSSQTALAVPTVFTNRAAWEAAVAGTIITEDFDAVPVQHLTPGTTTLGLLDFTVDTDDTFPFNDIRDSAGDRFFEGRVSNIGFDTSSSFIDVAFGSPVLAFGADFESTTTGADLQMTLTGNGSNIVFTDHLSGVGNGFLGVVDTVAFNSILFEAVSLTNGAEVFSIDNVSWSSASPAIPEPVTATLGLMGLGVLGMATRRRRVA